MLDILCKLIQEKHSELVNRKVVIFHNNARPYTSIHKLQKLQMLGWDVLPHLHTH